MRAEQDTVTKGVDKKFEQLFAEYLAPIRDYCARRVDVDRIDDATAEVFAIAWRKIHEVPPDAGALPWLYAVAYRVVFHHWRQAGRQSRLRAKVRNMITDEIGPDVADTIVLREDYQLVRNAAGRLRPIDQEILRLAMWEEIAHDEISEVLGINRGAVKQRLHRAKLNLIKEYRRASSEMIPVIGHEEGPVS
ncbi:MAG: RNA polymerase sigma factor [Acidimicrobiia bacterium]|nr:RNA polymerase sigma factor [Acidimicrobiia bacterium]